MTVIGSSLEIEQHLRAEAFEEVRQQLRETYTAGPFGDSDDDREDDA